MPECLTIRHPISPVPERKTNDAGTDLVSNQADAVRHFFWSGTGLKLWMLEC
jgi:hypothetical protein